MRWGLTGLLAAIGVAASSVSALAACTEVTTPQQLSDVRNDLGADYCLMNNLDMSAVADFLPIGGSENPFTGHFDGRGHTIFSLKIQSGHDSVGLFAGVAAGSVQNLRLAGLNVASTAPAALVGGLAGFLSDGGLVARVSVGGAVSCSGDGCRAGGMIGETFSPSLVRASSSSANVTSKNGGAAGGLTGQNVGKLRDVYATGKVRCANNCAAGGLSGQSEGPIERAFASGPVTANRKGATGGLIGTNGDALNDAYATGAVTVREGGAGLIGANGGHVKRVYAAGRVESADDDSAGGLINQLLVGTQVSNAYWDTTTSTRSTSADGTPQTTDQLRADLPAGFGGSWDITADTSYPFLRSADIDFKSTLATLVRQKLLYTFLPIAQRERPEYLHAVMHADHASLAAVYGMIARAIGITRSVKALTDVKLDRYFWSDAAEIATWQGPVTDYAKIGGLKAIAADLPLDESNVIAPLRNGRVVILRGQYLEGMTTRDHWMLATMFTNAADGSVSRVVANDPFTGHQVLIDPVTKRVVSPAGFPIANFKIDGYRLVSLK